MKETQTATLTQAAAAMAQAIGEDLKPDAERNLQFFHGLAFILARLLKSPRLLLGAAKTAEQYLEQKVEA